MKNDKNNKKQKIMIIGLDGATFNVLRQWINTGNMPNLSNIIKNGVTGELKSTIPPVTAQSWTSFSTGKNPGKHGIFGFFMPPSTDSSRIDKTLSEKNWLLNNSTCIGSETFWNLLGNYGKKIIIEDIPIVGYPPQDVNGIMISDSMRSHAKDHVFPPALTDELLKEGIIEKKDRGLMHGLAHTTKYIEHLINCIEKKEKLDTYLLKNYKWDCYVTITLVLDIFQHHFWKYIDKNYPGYNEKEAGKFNSIIKYFFNRLDEMVGNLIDFADDNTSVFIVSDHGFGPIHKSININTLLIENGFQSITASSKKNIKSQFTKIGLTSSKITGLLLKLDFLNLKRFIPTKFRPGIRKAIDTAFAAEIDWSKTKAYFRSVSEHGIYLNIKGKEPWGIIETDEEYERTRNELISLLSKLSDKDTGKPILQIYKKEDIYSGSYVSDAPDIIFELIGPYGCKSDISGSIIEKQDTNFSTGYHRPEGVFIVMGNNVKKGNYLKDAEIIDIAPTIMHLMGYPVPDSMDGKVLKEIFTPVFLKSNTVKYKNYTEDKNNIKKSRPAYKEEMDKEIKKQLEALGYL